MQRVAVSKTAFRNEGRIWVVGKTYEIPYRCLLPLKEQCQNLLVPVCVSSSHVAFCTLRVELVWMMMGQAAGTAAVIAARSGAAVQDVDVKALQETLRKCGLLIERTAAVSADDEKEKPGA